jgi:hypothetical protein
VLCDRNLPKDFPEQVLIKNGFVLTKQQVAEIQDKLPLAQMVTGKGSLFDEKKVPGKKGTYMGEEHVWKGPFDISKAGENLKVPHFGQFVYLMLFVSLTGAADAVSNHIRTAHGGAGDRV